MTLPHPGQWPWWTIHGEELMMLLRRCYDGADPELVYLEAYANSDHERHPKNED